MNSLDKLEKKLKLSLNKYALRKEESVEAESDTDTKDNQSDDIETSNEISDEMSEEMSEEFDMTDENDNDDDEEWKEIKKKYMFYYKIKSRKDSYFDIDMFGGLVEEDDTAESDNNKDIYIYVFDKELAYYIRKITNSADMFSSKPFLDLTYYYYAINDFRIRYKEDKFNNNKVKAALDFIEDCFKTDISKMDNLIKTNKIDYKSLWYYFDKVDTIYSIKHGEKHRICYKHESFRYAQGSSPCLYMNGMIYYADGKEITEAMYNHKIPKFKGIRTIDSFNILTVDEDYIENNYEYGERVMGLYKEPKHMHLDGYQYILRQDSVMSLVKNERIMVDEEGMDKYSSKPYYYEISKDHTDIESFTKKDKLLIFPYVSIYTLGTTKCWGMAHTKDIKENDYQEDAFDYLVLDAKKKNILKSLIKSHKDQTLTDFIKNKGLGLVFLLYGPPGVGKTLTAEATCEYLKKPLYNISVGDLGTNPEGMEVILERIVDYTRRWESIILIDEVDIFLEERQYSDVVRNAMVCTFLKFLEYNDGIIFLTTNRVGNLDQAVKSRVNLFMTYKALSEKKRFEIWKSLLTKWNINVTKESLAELSMIELNGREIRNYMRIVYSIHLDRKIELNEKSIIKVMKECMDLTSEFNKSTSVNRNMYI